MGDVLRVLLRLLAAGLHGNQHHWFAEQAADQTTGQTGQEDNEGPQNTTWEWNDNWSVGKTKNQPTAVLWIRESYKNLLLRNEEFTKINIQCLYSNLIYFFFPKPLLPVTENKKNKCVHKVRQSVNLWNTLAMRFALPLSCKKEEKEEKIKHKVGHHFRGDIQYPWAFSFHTDE